MNNDNKVEKLPHHKQMEFCLTRAKYRQGKKLTAVKVYTVNDESKYLIINGVPAIKLVTELERVCLKYGDIELLKLLPDYPCEDYSEVYLLKYHNIKSARFAKIQLDGKSFYGGVLHVCYAPELESVEDTREKLHDRRKTIAALTRYRRDPSLVNPSKKNKNKILNPVAERYLEHLKPELKNVNSDKLHSRVAVEGPSRVNVTTPTFPHDDDNIFKRNCVSSSLSDEGEVKGEAASTSKSVSSRTPVASKSLQELQNIFIPPQVKRKTNFCGPSTTTVKKIRVFGNKNILSYKSNNK
ncbi:RNA-binding protein 48-like [Homarus americanus]|uniref:RNA-binding protein 48-like n=1 Tax=Homarus americanus TaxID=6706 RepID=UPI001C478CDE|nr:RNA-binding protein 48-like [Homarus americanus]XP_042236432.1 RNA-binding protein 48-like [Homarus americanus]